MLSHGSRKVVSFSGPGALRVTGVIRINDCVIIADEFSDAQGEAKEDAETARPKLPHPSAARGVIHIEPGGSLHLTNALVMGTTPSPLVSVATGGTLVCSNSVLGPNSWNGSGFQTARCCSVQGTLVARNCSFVGGTAACVLLSDGASADCADCRVAGSELGKGAELLGGGTTLVAERCEFRNNHLACCAVTAGSTATFRTCSFERAAESGGLVVLSAGSFASAEGSMFRDNSRSGVFVNMGGRVEMQGCEVADNRLYAGLEVKGEGSSGRCRDCTLRNNVRAEMYVLAGATVELLGGMVGRGPAALYSVWAKDPGTVVELQGVSLAAPPSVFDGADVRVS